MDTDEERREKDLKFMKHADDWPMWPRLPMSKVGGYDLGVMLEEPGMTGRAAPVVYLGNMYSIDLRTCEKKVYDDLEAVLEDGWRVN